MPYRPPAAARPLTVALALLAFPVARPVQAQAPPPAPGGSVDVRGLRAVYGVEAPVFAGWMRAADASAYPAFVLVPAAMAAASALRDAPVRPALRVALSEAGAGVVVGAGKYAVRRRRPYLAVPGVAARLRGARVHGAGRRSYSFPSGHAALAFATATSATLSHPRAAVAAPAFAWAGSVALARVWHGVHYPSDVLAGAAVGAASAWAVDRLLPDHRTDDPTSGTTVFALRVPL